MPRLTATSAKRLSVAERKARVAEIAKAATGQAKRGIELIDFRELTPRERALAEKLIPAARRALARSRTKAA